MPPAPERRLSNGGQHAAAAASPAASPAKAKPVASPVTKPTTPVAASPAKNKVTSPAKVATPVASPAAKPKTPVASPAKPAEKPVVVAAKKPVTPAPATASGSLPEAATSKAVNDGEKELHKASHIVKSMTRDITTFKAKLAQQQYGRLDGFFELVSEPVVMQHLPAETNRYRSYYAKFSKGSSNPVQAFLKWHEWASFQVTKTQRFGASPANKKNNNGKDEDEDEEEPVEEAPKKGHVPKSSRAAQLHQTVNARTHIRAILTMCLRHNSTKRKEGLRALVNYFRQRLPAAVETTADVNAAEGSGEQSATEIAYPFHEQLSMTLLNNVDSTLHYAMTRLLLGMATPDFAHVATLCLAFYALFSGDGINCQNIRQKIGLVTLLDLLEHELHLDARMKVIYRRFENAAAGLADGEAAENDEFDAVDPDDINDPTKGERQQRYLAAVFALGACLFSRPVSDIPLDYLGKVIQLLSFFYVEHKGLRMTTGMLVSRLLSSMSVTQLRYIVGVDGETSKWLRFAFFKIATFDVMRPEGVSVLMVLMNAVRRHQLPLRDSWTEVLAEEEAKNTKVHQQLLHGGLGHINWTSLSPLSLLSTKPVRSWLKLDPLDPTTLEPLGVALFRREGVVACHPTIHPVMLQFLSDIEQRCAEEGESASAHVVNFINLLITPFRRGAADGPRAALFRELTQRIGKIALKAIDETERKEMVEAAVASLHLGKTGSLGKPTPVQELRLLGDQGITERIDSLLRQYDAIADASPDVMAAAGQNFAALSATRCWIIKEIRSCLLVERSLVAAPCPYIDRAMEALIKIGFSKLSPIHGNVIQKPDTVAANKACFVVAEILGTSPPPRSARRWRPMLSAGNPNASLFPQLLNFEKDGVARFDTCQKHPEFAAARDQLLSLISEPFPRSVIFFDFRLMEKLSMLLAAVVTCDDPSNNTAHEMVNDFIPDLVRFVRTGSLDQLEVLVDVCVAISMRTSLPMQALPLMTGIRRLCTSLLISLSSNFSLECVDMVVAPLVEMFGVDVRQEQRLARAAKDAPDTDTDEEDDDEIDETTGKKKVKEDKKDKTSKKKPSIGVKRTKRDQEEEEGTEVDEDTEADDAEEEEEEVDEARQAVRSKANAELDEFLSKILAKKAEGKAQKSITKKGKAVEEEEASEEDEEDNDQDSDGGSEDEFLKEDQPVTEQYLSGLRALLTDKGNADDILHEYPTDTQHQNKSDIMRSIRLVTRVGLSLKSSLVLRVLQVLLGTLRANVKTKDDTVFQAALGSVTSMLVSSCRFFGGHFVVLPANVTTATSTTGAEGEEDGEAAGDNYFLPLLADIRSYCRKLEQSLKTAELSTNGGRNAITEGAMVKARLLKVKLVALSAFHFISFVAYKNAEKDSKVRALISQRYTDLFCDRGWVPTPFLERIQEDMYHYRHGFAWVLLDAMANKFIQLKDTDVARRGHSFSLASKCCVSFLPRLSGLPEALKLQVGSVIVKLLTVCTVKQIFEMKHTMVYDYMFLLKEVVTRYMDIVVFPPKFVEGVIKSVLEDEAILVTTATIRVISQIEKECRMPLKVTNTKHATSFVTLHKQHDTPWRKKKTEFYKKANKERAEVISSVLAVRNEETPEEEKKLQKERRQDLRASDAATRAMRKSAIWGQLSEEERADRRVRARKAKQERIAQNKSRKKLLHSKRSEAFERWRQDKLEN